MDNVSSERWYDRLDRLIAEHAGEATIKEDSKKSTKKPANGKTTIPTDSELVSRCDTEFETMSKQKRRIDGDALTARVLQNGTLTDKIAAMALAISDEPVQSIGELEKLVDMSGSKGRREASLAMDALKDLMIEALLPPTRRLNVLKVSFERIKNRSTVSGEILGLMKFEDRLKTHVWSFVRNLERACKDELVHHKISAMKRVADLLQERPEQERFLLSLLCSKMGDPDHKAAAQASHLLRRVANAHPQMRLTMVSELQASILSTSASPLYVYESVTFLNQTILSRGDFELAEKLIDIYFALFERSFAVIEAVPSLKDAKATKKSKKNKKQKEAIKVTVAAKQGVNSRLMAALLTGVNRAIPFCNAEDESSKAKFKERCDQLHRIVRDTESFSNATQALALLFRLDNDRARYYKALASKLADPALIDGKKTAFLNLVYRSFKSDTDRARLLHNVKLLLSVALKSSASFAAASLFLLSNLFRVQKYLADDLLGEEPDQAVTEQEDNKPALANKQTELGNVVGTEKTPQTDQQRKQTPAMTLVAWELNAFRTHHHPTVQAFARTILDREMIEYDGDPLHDFSITTFLDKFVYRNPKEKKVEGGPSNVFGLKGREQRLGVKAAHEMPVNSEAFHERFAGRRAKLGEETDRFFFKYFDHVKKQGKSLAQGAASGRNTNLEDLEDEYADALVDKLLKDSAGGQDADVDDEDFLNELSPPNSDNEVDEGEFDEADVGEIEDDDDEEEEDDFDTDDIEEDDEDEDSFGDEDEDDEDSEDAKGGSTSLYADADDFVGLLGSDDEEEKTKHDKSKYLKNKSNNNNKKSLAQTKKRASAPPPKSTGQKWKKQRKH